MIALTEGLTSKGLILTDGEEDCGSVGRKEGRGETSALPVAMSSERLMQIASAAEMTF